MNIKIKVVSELASKIFPTVFPFYHYIKPCTELQ